MERVKTTEEVNAEYKTRAPKFDEKIHFGDTEDWVALSAKRKPFTVCIPPKRIFLQNHSGVYKLFMHCTNVVLCLYYDCTMPCEYFVVMYLLYYAIQQYVVLCTLFSFMLKVISFVLCVLMQPHTNDIGYTMHTLYYAHNYSF